jgi:ankyrin repeat protein
MCPLRPQDGQTPLHIAAGKGHKEVVGLLIDRGAGVEVQDYVSMSMNSPHGQASRQLNCSFLPASQP